MADLREDGQDTFANQHDTYYEFKSSEAQELLTKVPHWIIRWGVFIISTVLLSLLVIAYLIPYPVKVTTKVQIRAIQPLFLQYIPNSAYLLKLYVKQGQFVKKNALVSLLTTEYPSKGVYNANASDIVIRSSRSGFIHLLDTNFVGKYVVKGDLFFTIHRDDKQFLVVAEVPKVNSIINDLKVDQVVYLQLHSRDSSVPQNIVGRFQGLSIINSNIFRMKISLSNNPDMYASLVTLSENNLSMKADIIVNNKNFLNTILDQFLDL